MKPLLLMTISKTNSTGIIIKNTDHVLGDNNTGKASNASPSTNVNENKIYSGENDPDEATIIIDINDIERGANEIGIGMGK